MGHDIKKSIKINNFSEVFEEYDYIICDFGWDSSDIQDAPARHVLKEVSGHE